MEKMKKILCLLLAAVMLFAMAACNNEETPDSTEGTQGGDAAKGGTASWHTASDLPGWSFPFLFSIDRRF